MNKLGETMQAGKAKRRVGQQRPYFLVIRVSRSERSRMRRSSDVLGISVGELVRSLVLSSLDNIVNESVNEGRD